MIDWEIVGQTGLTRFLKTSLDVASPLQTWLPASTKIGETVPPNFLHKQLDFTERTSDDAQENECV
jgi:hypothetical protein